MHTAPSPCVRQVSSPCVRLFPYCDVQIFFPCIGPSLTIRSHGRADPHLPEMTEELLLSGADIIKVGIGMDLYIAYIRIYRYMYMYVCACIYMYVCTYIQMYIYVYANACIYICI